MANYRYTGTVWDFGHDMYGNPIAHFEVWDHRTGQRVACTRKQRQQTGYDGAMAEGALYALQKATDKRFKIARVKGNRSNGQVKVYFKAA